MRAPGSGRSARRGSQRAVENGHRASARRALPAALVLAGAAALLGAGLLVAADRSQGPQTLDARVQQIGSGLGCVTCQNLSVADSPAGTARAMRAEIRRRLEAGDTPGEIKAFFVEKYGQSILLSPRSPLPWMAPAVALAAGIALLAWTLWRRRPEPAPAELRLTPAERARIRRDLAALEEPD